ncbi:hypothetical protein [Cardinium endosymbiont of Tipula unca]|uniref:lipopolysaccharide biosynthesis protein n=1 Tax=Cardinium endosymbiont of Tipula unca TaxID=3066216 RepID=UPI0030CFDAFC
MHHAVKNLAKETIIYSLSDIVARGCSYFVLLLQTGILAPSVYGIVTEFYGSYIAFGGVVYLLSMDMAYFRFVNKLGRQYTFNTIVTILLLTSTIFSIILLLSIPKIATITNHLSHVRCFYYVVAILILDTLLIIPYSVLRAEKKIVKFISIKSLQATLSIVFSFILLYLPACLRYMEYVIYKSFHITVHLNTLDAIFITTLLSNATTFVFLLPYFKGFHFTCNKEVLRMMFSYASTSFFTTLFFRLSDILPILLFRKLVPTDFYEGHTKEEILGNLGTSYKLTLFISLGIQAFKYAAEPFFFAYSDRKDATKLYGQTMHLFILASCMALLLISLNIDWIAKILVPHAPYRNTIDTVPYLAFVRILLGIYYNFSIAFKLSNKPQYSTWISALGSFVIWAMALLLMPRLGHWGGVYASISGAAIITLFGYYVGKKCYPIPYYKHGFLLLLLTFCLLSKISAWPATISFLGLGWAYLLLNIIVIASFCAIVMVMHKHMNPHSALKH